MSSNSDISLFLKTIQSILVEQNARPTTTNNSETILNEAQHTNRKVTEWEGPDIIGKVKVKPLGIGNRWGCSGAVDSDLK